MRYTTIIDVTEVPEVFRNKNATRLYLFMTLRSGYHDDDRDLLDCSIRNLAAATGISLSATRHALSVLERQKLLTREGTRWRVKKWLLEGPISKRTQATTAKADAGLGQQLDEAKRKQQEFNDKLQEVLRTSTKEELQEWLQRLQTQPRASLKGVLVYKNEANIKWLENYIKRL